MELCRLSLGGLVFGAHVTRGSVKIPIGWAHNNVFHISRGTKFTREKQGGKGKGGKI